PGGGDITLGYLAAVLGRERASMDPFTVSLGASFATQAGLTLERLHTTQALLHQALGDELTGIGNRRLANSLLAQLCDGDAVVMIDLDGLKQLNDSKGHAAGDRALKQIAAHMEQSLRDEDVAARVGGDEFLMILRGAGSAAG